MPPPNATVAAAWKALLDMLDVAGLCEEDVVGTAGSPPPFSEQEFLELIGGISDGGGADGGTSFTPVQRTLILAEWRKRTGTTRSGNVSASPSNVGANTNSSNKVAGTPTSAGGRGNSQQQQAASPNRSSPRHNNNNNSGEMSPSSSRMHQQHHHSPQQVTMTNPQQLHPYSHVGNSAIAQQLCALLEEGNSAPALHAASELLERDAAELIQVLHTFLPHIPTVQLQDILGVRMGDGGGNHTSSFQNQNSMASLSGISHVPSGSPRNTYSSPIGAMEARMAAHGMMPTSSPSGGNMSSRHTVNQSGNLRDDSIARMEYNESLRRYEQQRTGGGSGGDYSGGGGSSTLRDTSQKIVDIPPSINGVIAPEGMLLTTQALSSQYGHGCLATVNGGRILHLPHVLQPGDCITVLRAQELVAVERERERNYRKH